jgi:hypothetical protein
MLLIDDLLLGGLRFVLDKLATVVDQELNDESHLHRTLMEAQMRFEMGDIGAEEFAGIERTVIDRLREIRAVRDADAPSLTDEGVRIGSVEISGPDDAEVDVKMTAVDVPVDVHAAEPAAVMSVANGGTARRARRGQAQATAGQATAAKTRRKRPDSTQAGRDARRQARR